MKGKQQDYFDLSGGFKIEEANRDFVDKSSRSVVEIEEFPEDFRTLMHKELNWARLAADGGESRVTGLVFWSRQDDRRNPLPVSDFENVDVIPDSSPKVKDKIRLALGRIILHPRYGQSLVQFWAAKKFEGRTLLTTQNQPFALGKVGRSASGLCEYRMKSMENKFYGDIGESGEEGLGLPGRVFLQKLPESAPDVQYYSVKEYPQRNDASSCQVRASWALPVFEHSSEICIGVLELVSAIDAVTDWYDKSFLSRLNNVFQELGLQSIDPYKHCEMKELGLQSIDPYKHCEMKNKDKNEALTPAFRELALILERVYKIHKLPLALTWVPCSACNTLSLGHLSSDVGEYLGDFEANDNHLVDFFTVSTGHHLRKGQVAERVLSSPNMLYCSDVTQFSIAEYPLVPFARQCKLSGWFTVCLQSSYTGEYVYILEFFLPANRKDNENPLTTIRTILETMKANSKTFKLASGEELGKLLYVEFIYFSHGLRHEDVQTIPASLEFLKNGGMTREREPKKTGVRFDISLEDVRRFSALSRRDAARALKVSESTLKRVCRKYGINRWPPREKNKEEKAFCTVLPNGGDTMQLDLPEEPSLMELDATTIGAQDFRTDNSLPSISHLEKERRITLKDLLQNFGRKREDVANSFGVSISTLKRIYRRHGILQWPYLENGGAKMLLDSVDQPSMDAEQSNSDITCLGEGTVKMPERERGKTGVDQPSMDAVNKGRSFISAEQSNSDITCLGEGAVKMPEREREKTGVDQPSMDAVNKGRSFISAEQSNSDITCLGEGAVKMPERERGKPGVKIQISLEDILQYSNMKLDDAASTLNVSSSTLKRLCRDYGINRWPPRNLNKVCSPQPSNIEQQDGISQLTSGMPSNQALDSRHHGINRWPPRDLNKVGSAWPSLIEHQDGISQLTSDMPSNQMSTSVAQIKPPGTKFQETKMVTIRAKYINGFTIKFQLCIPSRLVELQQQVAKRLNLDDGTYNVMYEDEDELILVACDEDLQDLIRTSTSLGKKSVVVLLEPKKQLPTDANDIGLLTQR